MSHINIDPQRRQLLLRLLGISGAASLGLISSPVWAASHDARLTNLRMSSNGDSARVVFDLDSPADHHLFMLHDPERLVIDFSNTSTQSQLAASGGVVKRVRYAPRGKNSLRVVLDLNASVQPSSFLLSPSGNHDNYRLVVDLERQGQRIVQADDNQLRDLVVVIDPGHGGKDPGAIGKNGTYEKDVVLPIGKYLKDKLNSQRGIQAHLTRSTDEYLHLRERTSIAHQHNADLFLSVHANACGDRDVDGASVYVLSEHGASSEMARQLAHRENTVGTQLVGDLDLSGTSKMLASVLLDLSQTAAISSSDRVARQLLNQFHNKLNNRVERAAFVVLKSPDIPSVLVETGFISNPHEERLLASASFQQQMADSISDGVLSYFKQYAPSDTLLASLHQSSATS